MDRRRKVFTSVADNGKGIEDNEKCKVFDAFYQIADENHRMEVA